MSEEDKIIDRLMMIDQWKVAGDIYTQDELNAIGGLVDLYRAEKEKNKELENKIKGKIKELNELLKETQKELGSASIEFNIYAHQKDILNCLLEE